MNDMIPSPVPALNDPAPAFRAFWVDGFHPGIKSPQEVDRLIADLQAANANAALVQVRRRGEAYYNKAIEPRAAELRHQPGFDPLACLIDRAHAGHPPIQVHAWLAALPIATASAPPTAPEHIYHLHGPGAQGDAMWLSVSADGKLAIEDTCSLDPGHPAASQYLVDVVLNLVRNYDVDGIHFDRIRYAGPQFGYNPVSVARYMARAGTTARPAPADPAWQQWRRDQVTDLVRQIYLEATALKPQIVISAATIPWGAGPANEAQWQKGSAMTAVFQDWLSWLREGILDMAVPMNYNREADAKQRQWFDRWIEWEKNLGTNRHVSVGLAAFLNDIPDTLAQVRRALAPSVSGGRAQGVAFYSYASTNRGSLPPDTFLAALAIGVPPETESAFPEPAPTPEMPWKTRPTAGGLKGTVRLSGGRPADGQTVELSGPAQRTLIASGTGFYGATGLPAGPYRAAVTRGGQVPVSTLVDVRPGAVTTADLRL